MRAVTSANRIPLSRAVRKNCPEGLAATRELASARAGMGHRASRAATELSKLIQPAVGVAPQPALTRTGRVAARAVARPLTCQSR
jgi:hypothetical protein